MYHLKYWPKVSTLRLTYKMTPQTKMLNYNNGKSNVTENPNILLFHRHTQYISSSLSNFDREVKKLSSIRKNIACCILLSIILNHNIKVESCLFFFFFLPVILWSSYLASLGLKFIINKTDLMKIATLQ